MRSFPNRRLKAIPPDPAEESGRLPSLDAGDIDVVAWEGLKA